MLCTAKDLKGYSIHATDDELGRVEELYFDDQGWAVRYLVVKPGGWFTRQHVLISPWSIERVDHGDKTVRTRLTRQQVKDSPDIDAHKPVSRQMEEEHARYFNYGMYWSGPYLWGVSGYPAYPMPDAGTVPEVQQPVRDTVDARREQSTVNRDDVHLRSSGEVEGYAIAGSDGDIGHVEEIVFDDEDWAIRYFVVDTRNWWPGGRKVVLATQWIDHISWTESAVQTSLTREQIKTSPEYEGVGGLGRDYETRLHEHYGRPGYWI